MLLRSQDKMRIFNLDNVVEVRAKKDMGETYVIIVETMDDWYRIAKYESKEVALFVLDFFGKMHAVLNGMSEVFTFPDNELAKELMNDPDSVEEVLKLASLLRSNS